MRIPNAFYLIVDVEATCSDDGVVPRPEMEVIEIGAVMQNAHTFQVESEFQTFIRPVRHPQLTTFCITLTGIAQANVVHAPLFPDALEAMKEWMYGFEDALFCSWGDYDRSQFQRDCGYHGVSYPFSLGHLNLKAEFAELSGRRKKVGLAEAVRSLGLNFQGSHHRGIDDARNIARVVSYSCIGA